MDRQTKATLWVAFIVIVSYFVWFYVGCAMDEACRVVCEGRICHAQWTSDTVKP
ncbi:MULTISPECIES: hypothetical protein [unclassified Bradyrhizobium]|uniref:hypothetical protein n=1 Tax=unclassified Bradyrhizobium TaxID=2631580 RepID=UPI0004022C7C|nr:MULTISPECIES: hypothetical protein [unclassified Bradyrhizobium]MCP3464278.1 hypothetical protein [Bradyrhizobium sp. CCGUVB23]